MDSPIYPPSPVELPKELTKLPSSYKVKAALALLAILVFFALFAAMVASLGYLFYYAIFYGIDSENVNRWTILLKIGVIAGSAMLFAFSLKFLFKLKNHKPENRIRLKKEEHPQLWAFVDQICDETGAPKPKNIYVDPDVNAYVAFSNSWLSLFLPVKKELTIGMGLVSCVNLTEFKAVTSHEFGHFAQRSMKIGSYIMTANTIIHDMIFSRDKWDELLDKWRSTDIRLSIFAWIITPVVWIIRQLLSLFYQFLNAMYGLLSQEMEFNADKVAVSTAGSDAIISALWKLDPGSEAWSKTINTAYLAAQKSIFVKNLYYHNELILQRGGSALTERLNELPADERGGKQFFATSGQSKVSMYASHPPNDKRQANAKVPFVQCEADERSPWVLFGNTEALQEEMTYLIYEKYLQKRPAKFVESEAFEQFIIAESKGNDLLDEYDNSFANRFLKIPEEDVLNQELAKYPNLVDKVATLRTELKALMEPVRAIEEVMTQAVEIAEGRSSQKSITYNGVTYKRRKLQDVYELLTIERENLFERSFRAWDTAFCTVHFGLAKEKGREVELLRHYTQHRVIAAFFRSVLEVKSDIFKEVNALQEREEYTDRDVHALAGYVSQHFVGLNGNLRSFDELDFVPMPNIENAEELKKAIIDGGVFQPQHGPIFENGGFQTIINELEAAAAHCQRVDQKSIGQILTLHHELAAAE